MSEKLLVIVGNVSVPPKYGDYSLVEWAELLNRPSSSVAKDFKRGYCPWPERRRTNATKNFAYSCWVGMNQRCLNPKNKDYPRYGGRGITVFEPWQRDFYRFLQDVGPRPSKGHSLDRINNDGNYVPGNVRWATAIDQAINRRTFKGGYVDRYGKNRWRVRFRNKTLGIFDSKEEAEQFRDCGCLDASE